jgi:thiol-disulfide isomerase/thioredoxin
MRVLTTLIIAVMVFAAACRKPAAPVNVSNRPISINGQGTGEAPAAPSRPPAEMSWTTEAGAVSKLGDFGGRAVILDLWATYCKPCIEEIPHLMSLKSKYGDRVELVGLHVGGDEDRPKIPAFVQKLKITYPIAFPDDDLVEYVTANDSRIPQTAVFDREGQLVEKFVGFDNSVKNGLDAAVKRAVGD